VGSGAEGTVKGAHVLNSTRDMSRSIADVYAVRADWRQEHEDFINKFVAGYLKATQQLVGLRREFEQSQKLSDEYRRVLTMSQSIFGKAVLPTLEVDAHGLLLDCGFVGLPGQISFFEDRGNLSGFEAKMSSALDLATSWGYARFRSGFEPPSLNYQEIAKLAGLKYERPQSQGAIEVGEGGVFPGSEALDDRTIVSFTIKFQPNQPDFSADRYGAEFNRAIQAASTFGNAVIVIRGHADPTKALIDMIKAGMEKGIVKRSGQEGNYRYFINGKPVELENTAEIIRLIESGAFETQNYKPRDTVKAARNLSQSRAEAVKQSLIEFAKQQSVNLDATQLQPTGAGISEPLIPKPANFQDALENMRVEFRIVRVPAEALNESDFAF
jgi:outer membrane protein OmpA-like peptidoglycan-associated protein